MEEGEAAWQQGQGFRQGWLTLGSWVRDPDPDCLPKLEMKSLGRLAPPPLTPGAAGAGHWDMGPSTS